MERYICIHGHFYQPPRENPWLECLEPQNSAYPYHDWNERVNAECYAPNSAARILDQEGRIRRIVNNYARISFNFGPTLLSWMDTHAPDIYQAVLEADRESQRLYSGHGSALAQAYNHMIMPLAHRRDKRTQVVWGLQDFQGRFGRAPEGMWLPETAVDLETLDLMAEQGIRFTILSPYQARRARPLGAGPWQDTPEGEVDPTRAYRQSLPSGRDMAVFFYDIPISTAVAFQKLLNDGEQFAQRLLDAASLKRPWPQLVNIATDGETYGHHHRFGDMALAYALHTLQSSPFARLTNYGEFLKLHPPAWEVEVAENTSWSCAHGVGRWRRDCGCHIGGQAGWSQAWRAPLREALDWLRDTLAPRYEEQAGRLLRDPWAARDDYIQVVRDRSGPNVERFFSRHARRPMAPEERVAVLKLLELQRYAMLMFTSCGWFFDDISGLEAVQILQYAGRALQLAEDLFRVPLEASFLAILERAQSNLPEHGDGRRIYNKSVKPAVVALPQVVAHYALSSLFAGYGKQAKIYSYLVDCQDCHRLEAGRATLAVGRARVTSEVTRESAEMSYGALHFGEHNLSAGVGERQDGGAYAAMLREVTQAFSRADLPEVLRLLERHFGGSPYSLKSLFREEQRRILERILQATQAEVEAEYRQIYQRFQPLMQFLLDLGSPLPRPLQAAAEFIINADLRLALDGESPDLERSRSLLEAARAWNITLDTQGLSYLLARTLETMLGRLVSAPENLSLLKDLDGAAALARSLPFPVDLWRAQNRCYELLREAYPGFQSRAQQGEAAAREWVGRFVSLGQSLSIRVE